MGDALVHPARPSGRETNGVWQGLGAEALWEHVRRLALPGEVWVPVGLSLWLPRRLPRGFSRRLEGPALWGLRGLRGRGG